MNNNTIRLYTYEDAIEMYKQQKVQNRRNILPAINNFLISNYITQKVIGLIALILITIFSLVVHDITALVFMLPICLGLILINKKIL